MAGAFYAYFKYSQQEIALLVEKNSKLQLAVDLQKQTIDYQEQLSKKISEENTRLSAAVADAEKIANIEKDEIENRDFNVGTIEEIEKRINDEFAKTNRDLERISGN